MTHKCPHPSCQKDVPSNRYACPAHWFQLPVEIRDLIWKGYRPKGSNTQDWHKGHSEAKDFWAKKIEQ